MSEAEILAEALVQHGIDGQIVQAAENTLLRHAQNTREIAVRQMLVILEAAGKQIPHKGDGLVIEALRVSLLNGNVVFVNDDDRRDSVMNVQHLREHQKRVHQLAFCGFSRDDLLIIRPFAGAAFVTVGQFPVALEFIDKEEADILQRIRPGGHFTIFKGEKNHRKRALVLAIAIPAAPDLRISEIDRSVLLCLLEESAQHVHVQGFAETARACEQGDHRPLVDEVTDQKRLIHVVIVGDRVAIIRDADREGPPRIGYGIRFCISTGFDTLIDRLYRPGGNQPAMSR